MSIDMTLQKWAIFIIGVYGENLCLLSDSAEISFRVVYKTLTHIMNVSIRKKTSKKKLSPKKPLPNLYEMNSS